MRKVKKWRYYCDYCKKSGGSAYHIKKHEKSCTANPGRKCGLCEKSGNEQKKISELVNFLSGFFDYEDSGGLDPFPEFKGYDFFEWSIEKAESAEKEVLEKLREFTGGCPACMLTAMRFTKSNCLFSSFDWKKERDAFFNAFCVDPYPELDY